MSTPPHRKDNDNGDKRKTTTAEDREEGSSKRRRTENACETSRLGAPKAQGEHPGPTRWLSIRTTAPPISVPIETPSLYTESHPDGRYPCVGLASIPVKPMNFDATRGASHRHPCAYAAASGGSGDLGRRSRRMMEMFEASHVPPPDLVPVAPLQYTPPTSSPMPTCRQGDYNVPVSEDRSSVPSEEVRQRKEDKRILEKRARKSEKGKKKKEKRREKSAEDASEDKPADVQVTEFPGDKACNYCRGHRLRCCIMVIAGAPTKRKAGPGPLRSAWDVCKKRKSASPWPGVKKAPKKSKPAAGKKKSAVVSSDTEVEEIAPVVAPRTRIDRAAERLLEAKRRLADVECENRDLRRLVWELQDKVHRSSEGSSRLAQFVAGLIGFHSGEEEERSWMGDAMVESQRITEDFRCQEGGQGGSGLTAEEKEEAEKKKRAEVDALANTNGGSEKSDDAEDAPKVKEEKMDEGESCSEEL
ncbi:hypothetical protein B0H19DRAFT_1070258 [Mycena capillaripes]|nr:hypothetical protein B0H19DRAFT_1070258 [Mycena capillaripes]